MDRVLYAQVCIKEKFFVKKRESGVILNWLVYYNKFFVNNLKY